MFTPDATEIARGDTHGLLPNRARQTDGPNAVTVLAVALYVLVQLGIAAWVARNTSSETDYLVAGRSLGVFAVGMSLFATWFASESVLATSAEIAADGMAGARVEPFAFGLGILLLGLFFAARLRAGAHLTLAGFFRERFGPGTETLSAVAIAVSGTVWASAQLFALATILSATSDISFLVALTAATALVLTYTLLGGLLGDVVTDMVQGGILVLGLGVMFALMISAAGGPMAAIDLIPPEKLGFSLPNETIFDKIEVWIVPIFASIVAQEAISRTLAARSPEVARNGAILGAGLYVAACIFPIGFGLVGSQLGLPLGEGDRYMADLATALLPPWLYIIFTGALMSAILSSVDSALLAVSAVATDSGYVRVRPQATSRQKLAVARTATVAAGLIAATVAASGESLRELVLASAAIGGIVAVPLVLGIVTRSGGQLAGMFSISTQSVVFIACDWIAGLPGAFVYSIGAGCAAYLAGTLIERRPAGRADQPDQAVGSL